MRLDDSLPLTITRAWLDQQGSCEDQADLFEKTWPKGVDITQKALTSSSKAGLNLDWFAQVILAPSVYSGCLASRDVLNADTMTKRILLTAKYRAGLTTLYNGYLEKCAPLSDDHEAKQGVLYAEYQAERRVFSAYYQTKFTRLDTCYMKKRNRALLLLLWAAYEKEAGQHED